MPKVGDIVVTMSYPGIFTVVEVHVDALTISDGESRTFKVRASNVRRVERDSRTER
jgi:hypothetical protein